MRITGQNIGHLSIVVLLTMGLILAPVLPDLALAAEVGAGAGTTGSETVKRPKSGAGGAGVGAGVSGSSGKRTTTGKGALAPPSKVAPTTKKPMVNSAEQKKAAKGVGAEQKKTTKGIGATASTAGTSGAKKGAGVALGWKIAGGVLGVGLLLGLAGGGGGGGGGSSSNH